MWVVMDDLREPNGVVMDETLLLSSSPSSSLGTDPFSIGSEPWVLAERATEEIIGQVQPTVASEDRRRKVIDYVQRLLKRRIVCEVFPFGSVPLKTYLPDGDIDLTAFGGSGLEESLANGVCSILEEVDQNPSAECTVKDVQFIRAEVKLVKCLVQNIVVDISFNQLGGLCTLCFLEQVDRLIGKDHLFKRSIILIKAWCYYESRILGAHHGLISTYALETLVLYIFHLFHSSLNGPLAVLYKFLDYFSKFDWENFCVSLNGPIPISSLPEIVVERPENNGGDLLLSDDFLKECVEKFSVPAKGTEASSRTFIQKHLNIVDPLKENNNLGRSVSKGNFFRIRSAFSYGARKLGQILLKPNEEIAEEVCKFFTNTLDRHGNGLRPDVQDPPSVALPDFALDMPLTTAELDQEDRSSRDPVYVNSTSKCSEGNVGSQGCQNVLNNSVGTRIDLDYNKTSDRQQKGLQKSAAAAAAENAKDDACSSVTRLAGDAKDLATTEAGSRISNGSHTSTFSSVNESKSPLGNVLYAPHLHFSGSLPNGKITSAHQDDKLPVHTIQAGHEVSREQEIMHSNSDHNSREVRDMKSSSSALTQGSFNAEDSQYSSNSSSSDRPSIEADGCYETLKLLPDLAGDFDNHLDSLYHARLWCDHVLGTPFPAIHPPLQWVPVHMRPNMFATVNANGVIPHPPFLPMTPIVSGASFGVEELPRTRGIGTYFPNTSYHSYRDRQSPGKGRIQAPFKSPRGNGRVADKSSHVKNNSHDPSIQSLAQSPAPSPKGNARKGNNGFIEPSEREEEFSSVGQSPPEAISSESRQVNSTSPPPTEGSPVLNDPRLADQSYHLKDEEDFPPLSV